MQPDTPQRGFKTAEFEARTARAQALMAQQDLAGMLLMSEPEVRYFTGFRTLFWQSPTRPWFVFVPATGKPVAVIPEIGAALMRRSWLDDIRTWAAPVPEDDGISLLTDLLSPLATKKARIGVQKGHETTLRMPLGDWERLIAALPGLEIADVTDLVRSLRMVKSPAEIEKLAHICAIGSATFNRVPALVSEGQPLEDVFRAFRREALAQGADDAPYVVGAADQGGYGDCISPPGLRPMTRGDVLMIDTGLSWDGYFCDFDRNWTEAGLAAARPGNTCRDLFQAMSGVIAEIDTSGGDIGRMGHGLGMQLTEQPSHMFGDTTVLSENMVLTLEPCLNYGDGLMMVHEENIVVGPNGGVLLSTRAAPELPVI